MVQPEINIEVNLPVVVERPPLHVRQRRLGRRIVRQRGARDQPRPRPQGRIRDRGYRHGHSAASEPGASFALNRQKLLDFGFRSLHVTAETAKQLARTYYGAGPAKSYYEGCSQGGRQGLTLAQRFPDDFDGIVAGSPALYQTGRIWRARTGCRSSTPIPFRPRNSGFWPRGSTSSAMPKTD